MGPGRRLKNDRFDGIHHYDPDLCRKVQVYLERLIGLDCEAVKASYNLWFWIFRAIFGVGFLVGVGIFVVDYFTLREKSAVKA
jgi:hypothetical protein